MNTFIVKKTTTLKKKKKKKEKKKKSHQGKKQKILIKVVKQQVRIFKPKTGIISIAVYVTLKDFSISQC